MPASVKYFAPGRQAERLKEEVAWPKNKNYRRVEVRRTSSMNEIVEMSVYLATLIQLGALGARQINLVPMASHNICNESKLEVISPESQQLLKSKNAKLINIDCVDAAKIDAWVNSAPIGEK